MAHLMTFLADKFNGIAKLSVIFGSVIIFLLTGIIYLSVKIKKLLKGNYYFHRHKNILKWI